MTLDDFLYERHGAVGLLTFNRPERLNACRVATYRELLGALEEIGRDPGVRVLVITGNGRAFCAGDDLKEAADMLGAGTSRDAWRELTDLLQEITRRVVSLPQPVIAAVNGYAVGFGFELSTACDIRIAADEASFRFTEVKHCLYVTNGVLYLLPRIVGRGRAVEWLFTGEPVTAHDAHAAGFVTHVVPRERLLDTALRLATILSGNAPIALRLLKAHTRQAAEMDLEGVLRLETEGLLECAASEDVKEGMRAFAERREPKYQGR